MHPNKQTFTQSIFLFSWKWKRQKHQWLSSFCLSIQHVVVSPSVNAVFSSGQSGQCGRLRVSRFSQSGRKQQQQAKTRLLLAFFPTSADLINTSLLLLIINTCSCSVQDWNWTELDCFLFVKTVQTQNHELRFLMVLESCRWAPCYIIPAVSWGRMELRTVRVQVEARPALVGDYADARDTEQ